MLEVLLNSDRFEQMYPKGTPLLSTSLEGVAIRLNPGALSERRINLWPDCEAHVDKVLSVLGEIGIKPSHPIKASGRAGTVADMLRDSMKRFSWTQELDFTAKAYLLYLKQPASWTNRFGMGVSLSDLIARVAEAELGTGACVGTHKCQVLAMALRADSEAPFLSSSTRRRVTERLLLASRRLEQTQLPDGSWPSDWCLSNKLFPITQEEGELNTRLRVTGHHLEWIAIAPDFAMPSGQSVSRALAYLQRRMTEVPGDSYYEDYTMLSHCARALVLFSGQSAYDLLKKGRGG